MKSIAACRVALPKYPNVGYLGFLYWELHVWLLGRYLILGTVRTLLVSEPE